MTEELYPKKRYATVKQAVQLYPVFTKSTIRWLIFNEFQNGFSACIRRIGRKVLIDLDEMENWINKQQKFSVRGQVKKEKEMEIIVSQLLKFPRD